MNRRLTARLAKLEEVAPKPVDVPMCAFHGAQCGLGTRQPDDLYLLVHEARRNTGLPAPDLDVHRPMTPDERARDAEEFADLLADARARNDAAEAEIRDEQL
ncbi:hypothetical protein ABZT34_34455 [Streptomyces sp. NPDC005329]|uniref:hypothetical protein n=1 Tax=Streptomyces sp. NPDC005329 TaxID=3157034 RepID=UPI0033B02EAA